MNREAGPPRHSDVCTTGLACMVGLLALLMVGCSGADGPERFSLSGTVTYDGQPVPHGTIHFEPDAARGNPGPSGSGEIKDGKYQTNPGRGMIGGPHMVRISGYDGKPPDGPEAEIFPHGMPLFDEQLIEADLPHESTAKDFDIPAS